MFLAWTDITGDYYLGFCFEMGFGNKKLLIFLQVFCKTGLWHLQKIFGSSHVLCIGEPTTSRALALFFITVTKSPVWLGDTLGLWCTGSAYEYGKIPHLFLPLELREGEGKSFF